MSAASAAPPQDVWKLLAVPRRWPEWAPHIRSVRGLDLGGNREVPAPDTLAPGQWLIVRGVGSLGVRAEITRVEPDRWDFDAHLPGPFVLTSAHLVRPAGGGSRILVAMRFDGPAAPLLDRTALAAYAPLAHLAIRRLAALAAAATW